MSPTVSVIVSATDRGSPQPCLDALRVQDQGVSEVIVVGDGELHVGAARATGDTLAFVDGRARPAPGWAGALARAAATGARIMAGPIVAADGGTATPHFGARLVPGLHDLDARNGFLPSASAANLAVERQLFEQLRGFEPSLPAAYDDDFCFRAQLAKQGIVFVPDALVTLDPPASLRELWRQRARHERAQVLLHWRYQRFAFQAALDAPGRRSPSDLLAESVAEALAGWRRDRRQLLAPAIGMWSLAASRAGHATGRWDLASGRLRTPPIVEVRGADEATIAVPLPDRPALLVIGPDVGLLRRLLALLDIAVPPPGLGDEAVVAWDDPAPWSLRLARRARAHGWRIPVDLAARRLENGRPRTAGQAYLALHGVYAWLQGARRSAIAASHQTGLALAGRLPGTPVVTTGEPVGDLGGRATAALTRRSILAHPEAALDRVAELLADSPAVDEPTTALAG